MSTQSTEIRDSAVRTSLLPLVVMAIVNIASNLWGLDLGAYEILIAGVIGHLAYTVVRFLEVYTSPRWGYILGLPKAPTYDA